MSIFATNKAVAALAFRLGELSAELDDLKRANRSLELEFTELYDKVRHQMSRMAKRSAIDAKANGPLVTDVETGEASQIDPVSAKILARRGFLRRQAE